LLKELQAIWLDIELFDSEELEEKEKQIKDRYNKIIELENKVLSWIEWNSENEETIEKDEQE
jgi:hypothetical protein